MKLRTFQFAAPAIAALLSAQAAFAQAPGGVWDHGQYIGSIGWFFMPLMMALVAGLTIGAIVVVVRMFGPDAKADTGSKAQNLLDERFARGEIDKDEYLERHNALNR